MGAKQGGLLLRDAVCAQLVHKGRELPPLLTVHLLQRRAGKDHGDSPGCCFPPAMVPGSFLGAQELPCQQRSQTLSARPG